MGAELLEDATQNLVRESLGLVGPVVGLNGGGVEIGAREGIAWLALLTREALEEAHDAARGTGGESEERDYMC